MAKKVILTIIFACISIFAITNISLAKSENVSTTLSDEATRSINKTERNMDDLVDRTNLDKAGKSIENGARAVEDVMNRGMNDIERGTEDLVDEDDKERKDRDSRSNNKAVAGTTGNYTSGQIEQPDEVVGRNGMTQNAWIWIVMVVVALIIVAAVWYYAAQRD